MAGSKSDNCHPAVEATYSAAAGALVGSTGYVVIASILNNTSVVGILVATGVSAGAALTLKLAYHAIAGCTAHKDVDIENPQLQEDTNLLPAQENKETFCRQVGKWGAGLFANCLKPEVKLATDLDSSVHHVHTI